MKKKHAGMHSATLPKEHWEKHAGDVPSGDLKYASEMGNPKDLERSATELVNYTKKNRMKY